MRTGDREIILYVVSFHELVSNERTIIASRELNKLNDRENGARNSFFPVEWSIEFSECGRSYERDYLKLLAASFSSPLSCECIPRIVPGHRDKIFNEIRSPALLHSYIFASLLLFPSLSR